MELGRSLSSKRSSAGAELIPSGLTERQALALALEESRRAAQAAERVQAHDDSSEDDDSSSSSDDESCAGGRVRRSSKENATKRKRQTAAAVKSTGGQRKRARVVELAEAKTGTSSENSKASRTTQQKLDLGAAGGESVTQAEALERALGHRRGESSDTEHRSSDTPADGSKQSADTHMKDAGSEGAGESGLEQGQQQSLGMASKLNKGGPGQQLDARTIAEMARKRREKFGTSQTQKQRDKAAAAAAAKLRNAPSGSVPKGQKVRVPKLALAASRPGLAELVESDLFPETPRRCSSSKTATPAATPTVMSDAAPIKQQQQQQPPPPQQLAHADSHAGSETGAAIVSSDPGASPVRTPSPMAGSPRSMQGSDTHDVDISASDFSAKMKDLSSLVKAEDAEEGSAGQESTPRESVAGGHEETAIHEGSSKQQQHPKQQQQRRKGPAAAKRTGKPARPSALVLPQDSCELASAAGSASPRDPQQKRGRASGNRAARSVGKSCPRSSRWTSPLSSPVGTSARRLRSAVVEEFKHNVDAMDAFAFLPQTPSRQRSSAVLQACGVLSRQDSLAASLPRVPLSAADLASKLEDLGSMKSEPLSRTLIPAQLRSICSEPLLARQEERPVQDAATAVVAVKEEVRTEEQAQGLLLSQPSLAAGGIVPAAYTPQSQSGAREPSSDAAAADKQADAASRGDGFVSLPSSPMQQGSRDAFLTPKPCGSPLEFPTLAPPSVSTPVLATPAVSPPASPALRPELDAAAATERPHLPLWRKLRPLYLQEQQMAGCGRVDGACAEQPAALPVQESLSAEQQLSPAASCIAGAAEELCAAIKGRHGLEGRRLELSCSAADDEQAGFFGEANPGKQCAATGLPYPGSRLGKALAALYGRGAPPGSAASFRHGCGSMLEPFCRARTAPAWKSSLMSRSGSAGSCSNNPHLARQRAQRNLQNTWDDLLARQALEAATAKAMVEWAQGTLQESQE